MTTEDKTHLSEAALFKMKSIIRKIDTSGTITPLQSNEIASFATAVHNLFKQNEGRDTRTVLSQALRAISFVLAGVIGASTAIIIGVLSKVLDKTPSFKGVNFLAWDLLIHFTWILLAGTVAAFLIVVFRSLLNYVSFGWNLITFIVGILLLLAVGVIGTNGFWAAQASICTAVAVNSEALKKKTDSIEQNSDTNMSLNQDKLDKYGSILWCKSYFQEKTFVEKN